MRPILSVLLGAVVAVLVALGVVAVIDHTAISDWLDYVVWVAALAAWLVWSFPAYLRSA